MEQFNNKFIGTIIKGKKINKSNINVIFKINDNIYVKKIKEKNKLRLKKYSNFENVNIISDDLNKDYVYIDSDNQPYFIKALLITIIISIFINILINIIIYWYYGKIILPLLFICIFLCSLPIIYTFYTIYYQRKKLYKNYTETIEGEIINYSRTEHRHDKDDISHCDYNIMYKYKMPNGNIIHSIVNTYDAKLLYKEYLLNKKVLIRYNPLKCCESCLLNEYRSIFNKEKFEKNCSYTIMIIGTITNILTKSIDEEVEDYLKEYSLVDYIECEYIALNNKYKTYSKFAVPHNRFKIGEKIWISCEKDNPSIFFCDIEKKYSNIDKFDY